MGEEFVIQSTAAETHQPVSPDLRGQTQDKQHVCSSPSASTRQRSEWKAPQRRTLVPVYRLLEGGKEAAAESAMGAH